VGVWLGRDKAGQFYNPYAYAGNGTNPVIMVDKDGHFLFILAAIGVAALVSGSISAYKVSSAGGSAGQAWAAFGIGFVAGGLGAAAGAGVGALITPLISSAVGATLGTTFTSTAVGNFTSGLITSSISGAVSGSIGGGVGGFSGGFLTNIASGKSLGESFAAGGSSALSGMGKGAWMGALGSAAGYSANYGLNALKNTSVANQGNFVSKQIQGTRTSGQNSVGTMVNRGTRSAIQLETGMQQSQPANATTGQWVQLPRADVAPTITVPNLPPTPTTIYDFPAVTITPDMINVPLPSGVSPYQVMPADGTIPW